MSSFFVWQKVDGVDAGTCVELAGCGRMQCFRRSLFSTFLFFLTALQLHTECVFASVIIQWGYSRWVASVVCCSVHFVLP
jgi:hypothetical protein